MPLYNYICPDHGEFDRFAKLEDYKDPAQCDCGRWCERGLSVPYFTVDNVGYNCPITGEWIGSKREHQENLAKQGCRVLETGETESAASFRAKEDAKLDKLIEDSVEREFESFSSDKKEQLHNELVNGKLDLSVERSVPVV